MAQTTPRPDRRRPGREQRCRGRREWNDDRSVRPGNRCRFASAVLFFVFAGQSANVFSDSVTWFEIRGNTIIQADADGKIEADFTLVLVGTSLGLSAADFVL